MKKLLISLIAIGCLQFVLSSYAQVPGIINYQGRIVDNGTNFTGTGQFQFALVNNGASQVYWSNGVNAVAVSVSKGLYSVLLGDATLANMAAIPLTVFTNADVRLRVWFNDGVSGLQQLSPDQRLAAVGYALMAGSVPDGAITSSKIAAGAVGSSQLASNLTISGTVTATAFQGNGAGLTNTPGTLLSQIVTGTGQQAQPNTGYLATNSAQVTITLPASPNVGDVVRVSATGAGGWKIAQNAGQSVLLGVDPGSVVWTETSAPGNGFASVASSSNGIKLVAAAPGDGIYASTNWGTTWTQTTAPSLDWNSVASSSDGTKLAAAAWPGGIYASTNSGGTWTQTAAPSTNWASIASSSDGTKLVAAAYGGNLKQGGVSVGGIYASTNSGGTWTQTGAPNTNWQSVASSSDGTKLVAAAGYAIYASTNSGATWTQTSAPGGDWSSVASSSDGTKLVAAAYDGIYTSTNSGGTWTQTGAPVPANGWNSVASSSDGTKLVAVASEVGIDASMDSGSTWTQTSAPNSYWSCVASSSDGTKLVAADLSGGIWAIHTATTPGSAGYVVGGLNTTIELMYIGNGQFIPLSHQGAITCY
jgi:hypothetical protein